MPTDDFHWTELMHSVRNHDHCCVDHVIQILQTEKYESVSKHGIDLLSLAVASGCLNMVKLILSYTSYKEGPINPICIASFYGHCDIINYLQEYDSNFIKMTAPITGLTALMFATVNNHIEAIKLLLTLGSNPYIKNVNNETVLEMTSNKDIKKLLLSKTKLTITIPKLNYIRNSPIRINQTSDDTNKLTVQKCSSSLSPYSPKRLKFLSPSKLKQKTIKTKSLLWEKFKKRKSHGKLECLLKEMDLSNYYTLFTDQEIDTNTLFTLSDDDLMQIGVEDTDERKIIIYRIKEYKLQI